MQTIPRQRFNSLRVRLIIALMVPVLAISLGAVATMVARANLRAQVDLVLGEQVPMILRLQELNLAATRHLAASARPFVLETPPEDTRPLQAEINLANTRPVLEAALIAYEEAARRMRNPRDEQIAQIRSTVEAVLTLNDSTNIARFVIVGSNFNRVITEALESEQAIYAASQAQLNEMLNTGQALTPIVVLVLIAGISALTFSSFRYVVHPLTMLEKASEQVERGDEYKPIEARGPDEIARLITAFNNMTEAIHEREARLLDLADTLERRVVERTHDLEEARDAAIIAQQAAERNNILKGEFLATMSHELRTPLHAIEGFTSVLLSGIDGKLDARALQLVGRIATNSTRLRTLVDELLDLSQLEAQGRQMRYATVSVPEKVQVWSRKAAQLNKGKALIFQARVGADVPKRVESDSEALDTIVGHLLSNAFKFTLRGSVTLFIDADPDGETWSLAVQDTGIGIPEEAQGYIFEPFRQVDGSVTRKYGGAGLGLALVKELAQLLDGAVTVESTLKEGSTFTVTLPLRLPQS